VAASETPTETYDAKYWGAFWHWYQEENGINDVVAFLQTYDLSKFDPKAQPPQTPGFWDMVNADRGDEQGALVDAIEKLNAQRAAANKPTNVLTISDLAAVAPGLEGLRDLRARRKVGKQLAECGYVAVDNTNANLGLWLVGNQRQRIYVSDSLSRMDREALAKARAAE
jgi:hypothetical protein